MSPRQVGFTARPGRSRVENEPGASREVPALVPRRSGVPEAQEAKARTVPPSVPSSASLAPEGTGLPRGNLPASALLY